VFDATFVRKPMETLAARLREGQYPLVAISTLTSMLTDALAIARLVKQVSPETLVVMGGPHPTVEPEGTVALEGVDAVNVGEGEISLPALADNDFDFHGLPGFAYMQDGEYVSNGRAPTVGSLDDIPFPAWDLLDMDEYLKVFFQLDAVAMNLRGTSIIASRGCPFNCAYCQPTLRTIFGFGRQVRRRSVGNIIGELAELKNRFNIDGVMWLDDTFLLDRDWMRELCEAMISEKLGLVWGANVRADVADRETLLLMKEAGLRIVHVGIESATQRILDEIYQKGTTLEQVRETVALSKDVGLKVRGYFMLGAPTETEQEAWDTVKLGCDLPLDDATFSITTPLPHTHLWDKTQELVGLDVQDFDYYKVPAYRSGDVIEPKRIVHIKRMAYLRFYLGPRRFWRTFWSVFSPMGFQKTILKLMRF